MFIVNDKRSQSPCLGSLITPEHVITSGQCKFMANNFKDLTIYAGISDPSNRKNAPFKSKIDYILLDPAFPKYRARMPKKGDLMIIKLAQKVMFTLNDNFK